MSDQTNEPAIPVVAPVPLRSLVELLQIAEHVARCGGGRGQGARERRVGAMTSADRITMTDAEHAAGDAAWADWTAVPQTTGRRRCGIPEHRRQIRTLQAHLRGTEALLREAHARVRDEQRSVYAAHARLAAVARTWGWVCRWVGHRPEVRYGTYCGRCGQAVPR